MGNRAVIAFVNDKGKQDKNSVGIYLHWNGGRDSVEGFLQTAKDYGIRSGDYGLARLTQIICNTFPGTLSVGVGIVKKLDCDNWDNGVYWVDKEFNIVAREHIEKYGLTAGTFKEQQVYPLADFVKEVKKDNDFVYNQDPYKKLAS
jgi:hypothetical protein|tara:strand:- start:50 stop:487 length:438 start_codon:yes stop_codon:yes gene_type:complete